MRVHGFRNACIINIKSQHADVIHIQMYMSYDLTQGFMNFLPCRCLDEICKSGENATEFLSLFKRMISQPHWKCYLSIKGLLLRLGDLINKVCQTESKLFLILLFISIKYIRIFSNFERLL